MLEGLPPNNAAHKLRLVCDEKRARAVADLIVESFEPAEAASTAFETEEPWPGGGKAWLVEAYFGFAPDEDALRDLVAVAAGEDAARQVEFGLTEKRDWVANVARRTGAGARRALSRPWRARPRALSAPATSASRSRRASPSAPAITARRAAASCISIACSSAAGRARCSTSAAAPACSPSPPPRFCGARSGSATSTPSRLKSPTETRASTASAPFARPSSRAASRTCGCAKARPYDLVFANILAKPLRLLAPSLAAVTAPDGEAIVSGLLLSDVPGVLAAWRGQGFHLAERIDLEGWASLRLRR